MSVSFLREFGWDDWNCAPLLCVSRMVDFMEPGLIRLRHIFLVSDAFFWLPCEFPCLPYPWSSLPIGINVITSSCLICLTLQPTSPPGLLRIACPVLSLGHLHFWCPIKLIICVLFSCFWIPGWLPGYKPSSPEKHTIHDTAYCLVP